MTEFALPHPRRTAGGHRWVKHVDEEWISLLRGQAAEVA